MTPKGYDQRWIDAINGALADRGAGIRIDDIEDWQWERYLGPIIDSCEQASEEREWEVRVPITVTAENREEAIKYALDDLRDSSMEWDTFEVQQVSGPDYGRVQS